MLTRRLVIAGTVSVGLPTAGGCRATPELVTYKTASCGCCQGWIDAMGKAGFRAKVMVVEDVTPFGEKLGVPFALSSCHLSTLGDYVVVGHVPPADVARLLKERPKGVGLTVPGMPIGSPGMESHDGRTEAFETLLLLPGGKTEVFARHA